MKITISFEANYANVNVSSINTKKTCHLKRAKNVVSKLTFHLKKKKAYTMQYCEILISIIIDYVTAVSILLFRKLYPFMATKHFMDRFCFCA